MKKLGRSLYQHQVRERYLFLYHSKQEYSNITVLEIEEVIVTLELSKYLRNTLTQHEHLILKSKHKLGLTDYEFHSTSIEKQSLHISVLHENFVKILRENTTTMQLLKTTKNKNKLYVEAERLFKSSLIRVTFSNNYVRGYRDLTEEQCLMLITEGSFGDGGLIRPKIELNPSLCLSKTAMFRTTNIKAGIEVDVQIPKNKMIAALKKLF